MLALKMEGGAMSQGVLVGRKGKAAGPHLEPPEAVVMVTLSF